MKDYLVQDLQKNKANVLFFPIFLFQHPVLETEHYIVKIKFYCTQIYLSHADSNLLEVFNRTHLCFRQTYHEHYRLMAWGGKIVLMLIMQSMKEASKKIQRLLLWPDWKSYIDGDKCSFAGQQLFHSSSCSDKTLQTFRKRRKKNTPWSYSMNYLQVLIANGPVIRILPNFFLLKLDKYFTTQQCCYLCNTYTQTHEKSRGQFLSPHQSFCYVQKYKKQENMKK